MLVPLSRPVLITIAIVTFTTEWNSLLWPLIATTRPEMRTLMVGLQSFNQEAVSEPNLLAAAAAFSMLPLILAFLFLQRFFIQSVARSGIKG
ncbi:carbohydrate ABC transporter permease [Candidatus Sumerlaeota bacterium]|nr:carbohydrate ABC transporter permease [Candidatus Sumerlaeota bacterium]